MLSEKVKPVSAKELFKEFKELRYPGSKGQKLTFEGNDEFDVYNPSVPFEVNGKKVIAGRVELRHNEESKTMFFEEKEDKWIKIEDAPILDLQDPFVTWIGGELVIGGVNVLWDGDRVVKYCTDFYIGTTIKDLKYLCSGPLNMKDVRLVKLTDGKIGIFSRPQGKKVQDKYGCIAKVGFTIVDSLSKVNADVIENAPIIEGHFLPDEWGGCNQLYMLKNGLIGAIGHIAWGAMESEVFILHYYSIAFAIDPKTRMMTPVKVISARECFPEGPSKNIRTQDVCFTSGIVRSEKGKAILYSGLSDCEVGCIMIEDPLYEYENL